MRGRLFVLAALAALSVSGCPARSAPLSHRFALTLEELRSLVSSLPAATSARVLYEPGRFLDLLGRALDGPADALLLVDKEHGLDRSWAPHDLAALVPDGLTLTKKGLRLRAPAAVDLLVMSAAARTEGVDLPVSSTYRSYASQSTLWARALVSQPKDQVERELARPGHSQHQLGTAVDFGSIDETFARTAAGVWMASNAWKFGWSLSFPEGAETETGYRWEPWHFRWIGRAAAELVQAFFGGSQQSLLQFLSANTEQLRAKMRTGR